jgi:ABC-2 type transport system permease protein
MSTNVQFQVINEQGWRRGFANLLRHENAIWWRSRRWWINILIWLVLINGMLLAMLASSGELNEALSRTPEQIAAEARTVFAVMAGMFGTIGVVIALQGSIIDEKKTGTAAWIMSKPVSRPAFILAKLVANIIALFVIMLLLQGVVAYIQLSLFSGEAIEVMPLIGGMALLGLHMLFYLSLTLMLGTLFSDRGPVIGIPIGFLFAAMFIMGYLGDLAYITPWMIIPSGSFQGLAIEAMLGQPLSSATPILATAVWSIVFVGIALWRFGREEF